MQKRRFNSIKADLLSSCFNSFLEKGDKDHKRISLGDSKAYTDPNSFGNWFHLSNSFVECGITRFYENEIKKEINRKDDNR